MGVADYILPSSDPTTIFRIIYFFKPEPDEPIMNDICAASTNSPKIDYRKLEDKKICFKITSSIRTRRIQISLTNLYNNKTYM
jgi:hypothetical protein